jgi:hypothetical protein
MPLLPSSRSRVGRALLAGAVAANFVPATGADAQPRIAPPMSAAELAAARDRLVDPEHCRILFRTFAMSMTRAPDGRLVARTGHVISDVTSRALGSLFVTTVNGERRMNCGGIRLIPTQNDNDFNFILGVRDIADAAAGVEFGRHYGFMPDRPPRAGVPIGSRDDAQPRPPG